jgi:hypothetical protein
MQRLHRFCSATTLFCAAALPSFAQQSAPLDQSTALDIVSARTGISAERLSLLDTGEAAYPESGRKARTFKVIDDQGQTYGVALDERGHEVRTEVLVYQEEQARLAHFGKLDEPLFRLTQAASADAKLPVAIWLVEHASEGVQRPLPEEMQYLFPTEAKLGEFLDGVRELARRSGARRGRSGPAASGLGRHPLRTQSVRAGRVCVAHA